MKVKYKTRFVDIIFIQLSLTVLFSLICYSVLDHFVSNVDGNNVGYIDCLALSTTIQGTTGITTMQASTNLSKTLITIQQMIVITTATYIIFTFTIKE